MAFIFRSSLLPSGLSGESYFCWSSLSIFFAHYIVFLLSDTSDDCLVCFLFSLFTNVCFLYLSWDHSFHFFLLVKAGHHLYALLVHLAADYKISCHFFIHLNMLTFLTHVIDVTDLFLIFFISNNFCFVLKFRLQVWMVTSLLSSPLFSELLNIVSNIYLLLNITSFASNIYLIKIMFLV